MSGFERSAPIPGSQGPRRSQMKRLNNAPPPMTPWRAEVLEAQKQLEAKKADRSRSRSKAREHREREKERERERDRERERERERERDRRKGLAMGTAGGSSSSTPAKRNIGEIQARSHGEGWYAAVARAAESWQSVKEVKKSAPAAGQPQQPKQSEKKRKEGERPQQDQEGEDPKETGADQSEFDRQQRAEFEARSEERRLKIEEEKKRLEEEKQKLQLAKKQRQEKLKGAFAVDGDDDEDDRLAELARRAAQRKDAIVHPAAAQKAAKVASQQLALVVPGSFNTPVAQNPEHATKLRLEPGLDPAVAFMRLQERKRKGRRSEFGGPPRGCSPWRDGKPGVSWDNRSAGDEGDDHPVA